MTRNRRLVFFVALVGFLFVTAGVGTVAGQSAPDCSTVTYNGDGTESSPYEVGNVEQLQCIEEQGLDANYVQVSDIDAGETASWNGGAGFDPIGEFNSDRDTEFNGTFDGAEHTISGLIIDRRSTNGVGLFGAVGMGGGLENVGLENIDIIGDTDVGGLIGSNTGGTVESSYTTGSVSGNDFMGGLVGNNGGTVRESYATGSASGAINVGGLVGVNFGKIERSNATNNVSGSARTGGLIGWNIGGTVESLYATGSVSGNELVGGLVGANSEGTVRESYAIGDISGSTDVGGLIGINIDGTVTESYWDTETTGQPDSDGGTGLTTPEMTGSDATSNMTGFDFGDTWVTLSDDYPVLAWQTDSDESDASPVDGVSDALWVAVTGNDGEDGLSLADLGNAIQEYQKNPGDADVGGVSITLSDLGSLIQYYQNEVA